MYSLDVYDIKVQFVLYRAQFVLGWQGYVYNHKKSPQKRSLKRGLPYLVGNKEVTPKALVPDYPPNKANPFWETIFEVTFVVSHKRNTFIVSCMQIWGFYDYWN